MLCCVECDLTCQLITISIDKSSILDTNKIYPLFICGIQQNKSHTQWLWLQLARNLLLPYTAQKQLTPVLMFYLRLSPGNLQLLLVTTHLDGFFQAINSCQLGVTMRGNVSKLIQLAARVQEVPTRMTNNCKLPVAKTLFKSRWLQAMSCFHLNVVVKFMQQAASEAVIGKTRLLLPGFLLPLSVYVPRLFRFCVFFVAQFENISSLYSAACCSGAPSAPPFQFFPLFCNFHTVTEMTTVTNHFIFVFFSAGAMYKVIALNHPQCHSLIFPPSFSNLSVYISVIPVPVVEACLCFGNRCQIAFKITNDTRLHVN